MVLDLHQIRLGRVRGGCKDVMGIGRGSCLVVLEKMNRKCECECRVSMAEKYVHLLG
jgi:hypothetical protein